MARDRARPINIGNARDARGRPYRETFENAAGAGFTGGTGTILKRTIVREGEIIITRFLMDITGLASSTTDLDIIGTGSSAAYFARILAAESGTIVGGSMACLEAPAGGVTDIDLYAATEGTGVFDGGIAALTETALVTAGGAWALTTAPKGLVADGIAANAYLYLTGGAGGTAAAYTAGRFLITLYGYAA